MRRPRVFGFVIGSIVTTLLGVGACGGKILEGSDALLDAGSNDATTVDAVVVDSAPQPGCDSIAGSTKPSGSQKGLFYESAEIFESSSIQGFGVGDVNGDGKNDLVVSSDALEIFLQNPCGGFDTAQRYAGSYGRLAVGDVTRDGLGDVVAVDLLHGGFAVIAQKRDGTLDAPLSYTVKNAQGTMSVGGAPILGKFDRDAYLDIFTGDSFGSLYLQRANGLDLGPSLSLPDGGPGSAFATGDFDGDGRADIVAATMDSLVTFLQQADGSFVSVVNSFAFGDYEPTSIAVGDVTGDHRDDVVVRRVRPPNGSDLAVFPQVDAGVLGAPGFLSSQFVDAFASADVDGDGRPDVVGAHGAFHLFLQSTPGELTEVQSNFGHSDGSFFVLADVDGDGKPDLVSITNDVAKNRTTLLLAYHTP